MDVASALCDIFKRNIENLTFADNMYCSEIFHEEAIAEDFIGWCNKSAIPDQIELILRSCEIDVPSTVLDVACGHGKHAQALQCKGHRVTAIDISATLINFLTKKHQGKITFLKRSFTEIDFDQAFDLIIVLGNSLSLGWAVTKRLYIKDEFQHLLAESGLKAVTCFGDWDGTNFSTDSPCQLFVAKRKEEI